MTIEDRLAACLEYLTQLEDEWFRAAKLPASQAQLQLLLWVGQHPGCRLQHIAAGLNLTAPTVSVGVRRLEQLGIIERSADGHDQRAISLTLSQNGMELYNLAVLARQKQVREILERLRPAEQRHLLSLLEKALGIESQDAEADTLSEAAEPSQPQTLESPVQQKRELQGPTQLTFFGG